MMDVDSGAAAGEAPLTVKNMTSSDYYFDSYSHFSIHEEMLKDSVRTESYRRAIMAPGICKGKVVLDVGCGTGILSMFAVKAGAKHVYAIDCATIIDQAREIARANGMADKITFIKGKVEEVDVPEKVDVLISEWMGYFLMYESMLQSVIFARDKWLKPGGLVLPDKCTLYINAIEDAEYKAAKIDWWGNVYGFNMSCIGEIALSEPLVDMVEGRQVVTSDAVLKTYDIAHATSADMVMENAPFTLRAKREDTVHAFVTFFDVQFTQSKVRFTTSPAAKYTHWKQAVLYLAESLSVRAGEEIQGTLSCRPNARNPRDLDIDVKYTFHGAYQDTSAEQKYFMR